MSDLPPELLSRLRERLQDRADDLRIDIFQFLASPTIETASRITDAAHKLAGIAATLGSPDLGACAAAVDAEPLTTPPGEGMKRRLVALLHEIRQIPNRHPTSPSGEPPDPV